MDLLPHQDFFMAKPRRHHRWLRRVSLAIGVLACLAAFAIGAQAEANAVGQEAGTSDPTIRISALEDATGRLSIREVLEASQQDGFHPLQGMPAFGYTKSAFWLRVALNNPKKTPLTIKIDNPLLESVEVFERLPGDRHYTMTHSLGSQQPKEVKHRYFFIPLTGAAEAAASQVFLRVASKETMIVVPIDVLGPEALIEDLYRDTLKMGLYYGILIVMLLYNGLLAIFLRERIYLLYALFLGVFGTLQLSMDGVLLLAVDHNLGNWKTWLNAFLSNLSVVTLALYSREFLELAKRSPRMNRIAFWIIGLSLAATLTTPFLPYQVALGITLVLNLLTAPFIAIAGYQALRSGFGPARFYLAGYSVLLLAIFLVSLVMGGVLPVRLWDEWGLANAIKFGSALEVTLFSFALADRITLHNKEHSRMHTALLRAEVLRRETQERASEAAAKAAQSTAIALMTQSLAHDIRKPFSMLKIGIERMAAVGDDPAEARSLARKIKEHVGRAFDDVNGMIADVLEVASGKANLHTEALPLGGMIEAALVQTFRYHAEGSIAFSYELNHSYLVDVDQRRVQRVFANILDNARQAMKGKGRIWIRSRDLASATNPMIEVTVGNSDSVIPPEDLSQIFEAFFTKGKKDGTGLGLAICYKIVTSHGGTIHCTSDAENGTEFTFTLPTGPAADPCSAGSSVGLPANSQQIREAFEVSFAATRPVGSDPAGDRKRRADVLEKSRALGRPLQVLIIDDEPLYAEGVKGQIEAAGLPGSLVQVISVNSPASGLALVARLAFDLIICDVDLGKGEASGFDLVRMLRANGAHGRICIHSNRSLPNDYRQAVDAGADAFLPKPMATAHLMSLIADGNGIRSEAG